MSPVIYHGTPLTPRAALDTIMPGRAGCVSFYRPEDLEALLAVCPQLMFRSWRLFVLDGGDARRFGMGSGEPGRMVASLLRMAGAGHLSSGSVRVDTGQPWGAFTDQRRAAERLAVRRPGRARLPHGRARVSTCQALREVFSRSSGMDWTSEARARWVPCISPEDGRDRGLDGQRMASASYVARHRSSMGLPLFGRGRDDAGTERVAL